MDMTNLSNYFIVIVVLACLVIGYCIKKITWLEKLSNQYIPTILACIGAILGCLVNGSLTVENIVYGALSGLASTGLHQLFTRFIEKDGE